MITAGSVIAATIRISPWHRGQVSGSTSKEERGPCLAVMCAVEVVRSLRSCLVKHNAGLPPSSDLTR